MKTSLLLGLLLGLIASGYGQAANAPGQNKKDPATVAAELEVEREKVKGAKELGKAGKVEAVEAAVAELNLAKKNTAEWHLETAQRLVQTAEELAREGEGEQVEKLVRRALKQLEQAEHKAKDGGERAAAKHLAGFVQERYLADEAAALVQYEGAAQLAPEEAKEARRSAERLKKVEANRKARTPDQTKEIIDTGETGAEGQAGRGSRG